MIFLTEYHVFSIDLDHGEKNVKPCVRARLDEGSTEYFEYFEAELIFWVFGFGDYFILVGGEADGYEGVFGFLFRCGAEAELGKEHAPPIFSLGVSYEDPDGAIGSCREAYAFVAFLGVFLVPEGDLDGHIAAELFESFFCAVFDIFKVFLDLFFGGLDIGAVFGQACRQACYLIADGELYILVLLAIRVCEHVESYHAIVYFRFTVDRQKGEQGKARDDRCAEYCYFVHF